ncbi:hypothetical protein ACWG0P_10900 [Amedibacillus sp. YH-ame6]
MKAKKLLSMIMVFTSCLTACGSASIKLQKETFNVELGEQINTKASTYLAKDTDKDVLKESKVSFKESKYYSVDNKSETLKAKDKDYLPVGRYSGSVKYQDNKQDFIVEVKDTTAPKFIDFKDEISIEVGSEVKLEGYFKAEDLSQVSISINKDKLDITKEGSYEIQVTAADEYKNKDTKKATIKVIAKEVVEEPAEETANNNTTNNAEGTTPGNNAQAPSNGSNSNTGGDKTQAPSQPQQPSTPNVCTPNGTYQGLGNSGMWFNSMKEAEDWAWDYIYTQPDPWTYYGYHAWTVEDSCGESRTDIWSIHFY